MCVPSQNWSPNSNKLFPCGAEILSLHNKTFCLAQSKLVFFFIAHKLRCSLPLGIFTSLIIVLYTNNDERRNVMFWTACYNSINFPSQGWSCVQVCAIWAFVLYVLVYYVCLFAICFLCLYAICACLLYVLVYRCAPTTRRLVAQRRRWRKPSRTTGAPTTSSSGVPTTLAPARVMSWTRMFSESEYCWWFFQVKSSLSGEASTSPLKKMARVRSKSPPSTLRRMVSHLIPN